MKIEIEYEILEGWNVRKPEKKKGTSIMSIFMPYGLSEVVILPGDDAIVPTGLRFPRLFHDFLLTPISHTVINKESDVFDCWEGYIAQEKPILHESLTIDNNSHIYIHIINHGKTELIIKPGARIAFFCATPILEIE